MNKKEKGILVLGCGGHARFVLSLLKSIDNSMPVALVSLDDDYDPNEVIMNTAIVGCHSSLTQLREIGFESVVLGVGDNAIRKALFEEVFNLQFELPCLVHPSAIIDSSASMSLGNVVGPNVVIGSEVVIGSNNIINSSSVIEHQSIIGNHCHISLSSVLCGAVHIGDEVFVGANSTIIEKVSVGSNTILGAGTNVIRSISKNNATFVGNPARILSK